MSRLSSNNKNIAKNTMFLYFRMIIVFCVNLYTVRVIWNVLGVDNYGIYTLVGGIVLMFQFLNGAMVSASQRFIAYEIGRGDTNKLNETFNNLLIVHLLLAGFVFLIGETVGLWFINTYLNIPVGRHIAANWVYQCSLMAFMINIISTPYNSCIVAHEHMKIYGYFGIIEVFLKLFIVFMLIISPIDKLIAYSILVLMVSIIMRLIYSIYCKKHFKECKLTYHLDINSSKNIFFFAGWSLLGNLGFSFRSQGLNVILNLFFNVAVNAAKGIANQVSSAIYGFTSNFQMALNPQIIKRYASGDIKSMLKLVFLGSKFSFFLLMIVNIPLFIACESIMRLWLGDLAPYSLGFTKLILIMLLIDSLAGPLVTAMQAVGKIKVFQIAISAVMISTLIISWFWLKIQKDPYVVIYASILTSTFGIATRVLILHNMIKFSYIDYCVDVIIRCVITCIAAFCILSYIYSLMSHEIINLICFVFTTIIINLFIIYGIGLNKEERLSLNLLINKKLKWRKQTNE